MAYSEQAQRRGSNGRPTQKFATKEKRDADRLFAGDVSAMLYGGCPQRPNDPDRERKRDAV